MKADSYKIAKVFSSGGDIHYVLPHFQREYAWERDQWHTLLQDAVAIHEEVAALEDTGQSTQNMEHFLGSLVVVNSGTISGTITEFKLVDGQQRLTTISLLFCALARIVAETDAALAKKITRLLVNEDEKGDNFFKVLPTTKYGDRAAYKAILQNKEPPQSESRIPAAFHYLHQQLNVRNKKLVLRMLLLP